MWRKSIDKFCKVTKYNDNRLIGIEIECENGESLFVNVYLPYQCADNKEEYDDYLGKLSAIVQEASSTSNIIFTGDVNASVNSNFEYELNEFCNNASLIISNYEVFRRDSGC